jgi:HD-GYP domain-containing protein (c-di-GMP phosphodiesterase class II)
MQSVKSLKDLSKSIESLPIFVVLDSLYSRNDDSPVARNKSTAQRYGDLAGQLGTIINDKMKMPVANNARELPFTTLFSLAEMIIYSLTKTKDIMLQVMQPEYKAEFIVCHSLNVAFLSCKVAMDKGFDFKQLTEITVAGLLHDIGMTKVGKENFEHGRSLNKNERDKVDHHPEIGYQFFQPLSDDFPWLLRVIMEEHRRENNLGYPEGPIGELHPYSKIVGVCDAFEALTHRRSFRKAIHPAEAMRMIIDAKNSYYAKDILRAMIESLSIYPVGSLVQLNNKRIAQVVEAVTGSPLRPIVQLISSNNSNEIDTRMDLSRDNNLYITGLVYDKDYQVSENVKKQE